MELRKYQQDSIDGVFNYYYSGKTGNPLVVAPTGSGKSVIIAAFVKVVLDNWKHQRILILAHRKELLEQNFNKIIEFWNEAPVGIYSAGLRQKKLHKQITVAGIQSIYSKAKKLGWIDLVIADECHLIAPEGEGCYRTLIKGLMEINKDVKIIGLTATPFRMKSGSLTDDGGFFTDIAYDIEIPRLIEEGYLSNIISKGSIVQADLNSVGTRGGEYIPKQAEEAMIQGNLTLNAIIEIEKYASDRKSWIVFATGIKHANSVTKTFKERGHNVEMITGETPSEERKKIISNFKNGIIKGIVGVDVLTTGFDAPRTDLVVLLRPTKSPGLYIQMVGRGMRLSPDTGKQNCLLLDFAGNIERHGPIDAIKIKKTGARDSKKNPVETFPIKFCDQCRSANAIAALKCYICQYEFPVTQKEKHSSFATKKEVLTINLPPEWRRVTWVGYSKHSKIGKPDSLKITYHTEVDIDKNESGDLVDYDLIDSPNINEWILLEHSDSVAKHARIWWNNHIEYTNWKSRRIPTTVDSALELTHELRKPKRIQVKKEGRFYRVLDYEYYTVEELLKIQKTKEEEDEEDIPF